MTAIALMLVIEGLLPFLVPKVWRDAFRRLTELSDGQVRFIPESADEELLRAIFSAEDPQGVRLSIPWYEAVFRRPIELRAETQADPHDICSFVGERIADFKVPQYVVIRNEPLPRNPGGKILKAKLRKEVQWGAPLR